MSSSPPPTYVVNIYNPAYFTSSTTGLTQAQANNLYLQKGTPDTATALETFTGGVAVNTLQPTSTTGDLSIYPAQTAGNIYLGVNSTSSTGRTGTIHIGDGNSMPVGATVHINNGTSNASNTNIMNGTSTSGTCNILTGNTTSGTVNIATGSGTSTVNIGSGSTTGAVTIGNSANVININTPLALGYVPSAITGSTQLGYNIASTGTTTSVSGTTVIKSVVLTAGVWILYGNARFVAPGTFGELSIGTSTTVTDNDAETAAVGTGGLILQATRIIKTSVGVTYNLLANCQLATTVSNVGFFAYRIG